MAIITEKIREIQEQKDLSLRALAKLADYEHGGIGNMINAKKPFPEKLLKKLLPILEISREEFDSWIIADKYTKEVINLAIKAKQETKVKRKQLILTLKIDAILDEKDMSRTDLSKQIKYSQSGLNRMIVGKIGMSKSVLKRISEVLEISQDEILSWILADKYSLSTFEKSISIK